MNNGKKFDLLIEDETITDPRTGVESINKLCFTVWADAGMQQAIEKVEGVLRAYTNQPFSTKYSVYFDQRYDREYVKREIEAAILTA
jgi:hypothetical protein